MEMFANNEAPPVDTMNIIADTKFGEPNAVVVVGSHLDGVLAGNTSIAIERGIDIRVEIETEIEVEVDRNTKRDKNDNFIWMNPILSCYIMQ